MSRDKTPGPSSQELAFVVVNYNGGKLLAECIASIRGAIGAAGAAMALVVVDNASADGSAEAAAGVEGVELVSMGANRGFGAAANAGIAATNSDWIALVNADATVAADAAAAFIAAQHSLPGTVGVVAPQVRFASDRSTVNSAGVEVDALGIAHERFLGQPAGAADQAAFVFGASGGGAFLRRSMLDSVGLFDERYFLYYEDIDLCWRAQAAGWKAMYEPRVVLYHQHSAFVKQGSELQFYHVGRNRIRTLAKNAPASLLRRNALRILIYDAGYVSYAAVRRRSLAPLRGRLDGLRDWRTFRARTPLAQAPLIPAGSFAAALRRQRVLRRNTFNARP